MFCLYAVLRGLSAAAFALIEALRACTPLPDAEPPEMLTQIFRFADAAIFFSPLAD